MKYIGEREPHYGLRKLSIGVASVLLGISIYGVVGHADNEVPVSDSKNNVSVSKNVGDDNNGANDQVVLRSKTEGDSSSTQNIGRQGIRDQESIASDVVDSQNTLNTSGVQNDVKPQNNSNNVLNNASSVYSQSLILSTQTSAHNTQGSFELTSDTWNNGPDPHQPGTQWILNGHLSFQLNMQNLKNNDLVLLGRFKQTSDTNRMAGLNAFYAPSVSYQGKKVGLVWFDNSNVQDVPLYLRLTDVPKTEGMADLSVDADNWIRVNQYHGDNFRGISVSNNSFIFENNEGKTMPVFSFTVKQPKLHYFDEVKGHETSFGDSSSVRSEELYGGSGHIVLRIPYPEFDINEDLSTLSSNNVDKPISVLNKTYQFGYDLVSSTALLPNIDGPSMMYSVVPVLDHGRYINQQVVSNQIASTGESHSISNVREADGLSMQQLKAIADSQPDVSQVLYSVQGSNHIIFVVNLIPDSFRSHESIDKMQTALYDSVILSATSDPKANALASAKAEQNVFSDYPQQISFWTGYNWADGLSNASVRLTSYDLSNNKQISNSTANFVPNDSKIEGQSTVKLHVVSSTNGTDLAIVKSFTDWPNQGKHAQLDIPMIAGYQLAEDPQSVLTKLHLNGKVVTANSAVDYPGENTIADYYIVMAPKDENMTVNIVDDDENGKVLDSGRISGKFSDRVVETSDIQGKVKKLLDSGLYTLESNDLDNGLTFKDGSQTATVKLKHKLDSIQRHYRVIEDLPVGTKKVIIDMEATLYKDAARSDWQDYGAYTVDGKLLKTNDVKLLKQTNILDNPGSAMDWVNANIDSVLGYRHYIDRKTYPHYGDYYGGLGIWGDDSTIWMDLFRRADSHDGFGFATSVFPSTDFHILYTPKDEVATVNIVDADENNKVLSTGTVTGKFNTQIITNDDVQAKLKSLLDTGHYVLQSNGFDQAAKYQDGTNTITIVLKHKIDSTQRHYRVIEDLPDGTKKVIIDMEATLYKDSDSDNWYFDGAHLDGQQNGNILQANVYDDKLGTVLDDASYLMALVDLIPGYSIDWHKLSGPDRNRMIDTANYSVSAYLRSHPTRAHLDMFNGHIPVTNILDSCDGHIYYMKNQYPVTLSYYDLTGKLISSTKKNYDYQTVVDLTATAPANYVLLSSQPGQLAVGTDTNKVDLLVAPKIERSQENKVVTRTINLHGGNVKIGPVIQKVVFVREKVLNLATGDTSYGNWQVQGNDQFSMYVPPIIDGYHINKVDAKIVSADDSDSTVDLDYEQNESEQWPMYIDVNGKSYDKLPGGYHVVKGQNSKKGSLLIVKDESVVAPVKVEYVTRIITVIMPNGRTRTIKQKARKGSKFLAAHLPKLKGYRVEISGNIDSVAASGDMTASVKFVKM